MQLQHHSVNKMLGAAFELNTFEDGATSTVRRQGQQLLPVLHGATA